MKFVTKVKVASLALKGLFLNYWYKLRDKIKGKKPKKEIFHNRITYAEWKPGRSNYYEIVDMVRTHNDLDFSEDELRDHYTYLTSKLMLPHPEGDKIAKELHEAYQCLVDPHKRMMYNMRLDLGDPKLKPERRLETILHAAEVLLLGVLIYILK